MNKTRLVAFVSIISIVAAVTATLPVAYAKSEHSRKSVVNEKKPAADADKTSSLEDIYSGPLPMVSLSIDKAIKAVEAGSKETALAELRKAKKMLAVVKKAIGERVKPEFANVRCPIMGSPINPDKVTKALTRDYKDRKVAFCCGKCPGKWDKLSDTEKDAKLAGAGGKKACNMDKKACNMNMMKKK